MIPLNDNQPWRIQIVPPWHPDVRREFEQALVALGQTGIPKMSEVVYAYMHGVGPSRGEELWLRPQDIADWQENAGLTPRAGSP